MRAAVVREHGGPDRLNFEASFPDSKCGEGDVMVEFQEVGSQYVKNDAYWRKG